MLDRSFTQRNRAESQRLQRLAATITDQQLTLKLDDGWTVAETLAHLAFWDQQRLALINAWQARGLFPESHPADVFNEALQVIFAALPPRAALQLAVESAKLIDVKIESLSDDLILAIRNLPDAPNLERATHRQEHFEQLRQVGIDV